MVRATTSTVLAVLAGALCSCSLAGGASLPADKAEIVYSNGGRIIQINADGSDRKVLTRKNGPVVAERSWDAFIPVEDSRPSISPDGTKLLFERKRDLGRLRSSSTIVVANRDGTGQKEIEAWENTGVNWLAWSPDNRILAGRYKYDFSNGKEVDRYWTVSMNADGTNRKVLACMAFREKDFPNHQGFLASYMAPVDISPDGKSLLYVVGTARHNELRVSGSGVPPVLLKRDVNDAAFSPDGSAIVFESGTCITTGGEDCDLRKSGLWTMGADGTGLRHLVGGVGGTSNPDWSADGSRIVFSSSRNFPGAGRLASEIYSVGVDGSCLSWLTNGSPESTDPGWSPEAMDTAPGSCGANALSPLVEVRPEAIWNHPHPRLWAGTEIRGRLLSSAVANRGSDSFYYEDCAQFESWRCREGLVIDSMPTCNPENLGSGVQWYPYRMVPSMKRGAWLNTMRTKKGSHSAMLITGRATLSFGDSVFIDTGGIPTSATDLKVIMALLRPVGKPIDSRQALPPARIPAKATKMIARTLRAYRQTGSVRQAANRSGNSLAETKWLVNWRSVVNQLMPFKPLRCGR